MKNIKTKPMLLKKRPNKLRGRFSLRSGSLAIWLMELGKFGHVREKCFYLRTYLKHAKFASHPPLLGSSLMGEKKICSFETGARTSQRKYLYFFCRRYISRFLFVSLFCLPGPESSCRKTLATPGKQIGRDLHTVWVMVVGGGGTSGQEPACQCRRQKEKRARFLGLEDPLEE